MSHMKHHYKYYFEFSDCDKNFWKKDCKILTLMKPATLMKPVLVTRVTRITY